MANGISIHIGLNRVDPIHYEGWNGALVACEFDAKDMQAIAKKRGYKDTLLLTQDATAQNVINAITAAAKALKSGDQLFLTYSGHGGQVPDKNGDEPDSQDETWVMYDRELIDDELYALWAKFKKGVRILMLSDSCHSGSVAKVVQIHNAIRANEAAVDAPRFRAMPMDKQAVVYRKHKKLYDGIQKRTVAGDKAKVNASVILVSGCLDNQLSGDGDRNGLFTGTLLTVWNSGKFKGSLNKFAMTIRSQMPPWQSPNYFKVGAPNAAFEKTKPFTL